MSMSNRFGALLRWCCALGAVALIAGLCMAVAQPVSASTCALCTNFVTTYDPDGPGPKPAFTRLQSNLLVDVTYAIDVTGNLAPLPLGLIPLPGYELSIRVQAIDPNKPTIIIKRLGVVPATLPLRVELVTGDLSTSSAAKQSVGYDTLASTAPQSFMVVVDLSDRDHNAATTQALAAITITGAATSLTLLEEEFTGSPTGTRIDDAVHRLTFSGNGTSTHVPSSIGIDLTNSATSTHAILTHNLVTNLGYDMSAPGGLPRTIGTLQRLPAKVDLTLTDVDLNGDNQLDKRIDYVASAPTALATLEIQTASATTDAAITALPATFHITAVITDPHIDVTYHGSSRATEAVVTVTKPGKTFTADVVNVPANIDTLTYTSTAQGGTIAYSSDARATSATLTAADGGKHASAVVTGVPAAITVDYSSAAGEGHYHYSTSGDLATHATLTYTDERHQHFVLSADQIPSVLDVDYTTTNTGSPAIGIGTVDDLTFTYHASSRVPDAQLQASNLVGFVDRAKQLDVTLEGVPTDFSLTTTKTDVTSNYIGTILNVEHDFTVQATTGGGALTHATILMTSGPDDELPLTSPDTGAPVDGVLYRDVADRFVVSGRISEFTGLKASQTAYERVAPAADGTEQVLSGTHVDKLHAELDTNAPSHFLEFLVDRQPQVPPTNTTGQSNPTPPPTDETIARLAGLPTQITLDADSNELTGKSTTVWNASSSVKGYPIGTTYQAGFELTHASVDQFGTPTYDEDVRIDPMPKNFTACQSSADDSCSAPVFDANLTLAHDGPTQAEYDAACDKYGKPDCDSFVPWFYRSFACFGINTCGNPTFDAEPGDANQGSVLLQADEPITLSYSTGDYINSVNDYTSLYFSNLTRFVLQAHDSGAYDCGSTEGFCRFGTIDLDTNDQAISGYIKEHKGSSTTFFNFPSGFVAGALIWDFKMTSDISGRHATIGDLTCPSGTTIRVGGDNRAGQICNGDLQP